MQAFKLMSFFKKSLNLFNIMHLYEKVYEKGLPLFFRFVKKLILNPQTAYFETGKMGKS